MEILDNGLEIENDVLQYAWYQITTEQGVYYRCVALRELAALPVDSLEDYNLLGKQWGAVRGLYNAGVNFIYTASGIFTPEHIGVVQFYGAAVDAATRHEAASKVAEHISAVIGVLANFTQSRTRPPDLRWVRWYIDFVTRRSQNVLAILGYPDQRESARGLGQDGKLPDETGDDLSSEQNELLYRGLAKLREDFVFQVTSRHIGRKCLTDTLVQVAQVTSNFASRRKGSMSVGFSLGIPLMAALSNTISGGQGIATSQAHTTSDGQSHSWGQGHTDSYSHTESQAHTVGGSETHSAGSSHTDSQGHTDSSNRTDSMNHSDSWSETASQSHSDSSMSGGSDSHTPSSAHSDSTSLGSSATSTSGISTGSSASLGTSSSAASGHSDSWNASASVSGGVPGVASASVGGGIGRSDMSSSTIGSSSINSESSGTQSSTSIGASSATGLVDTTGSSDSHSSMWSVGSSDTLGSASSVGGSDTVGHANTTGQADSTGSADGTMESSSISRSWADTHGTADSWGRADSRSEAYGQSHTEGKSNGQSLSRAGSQGYIGGLSTGLVPGVSLHRSWQLEDDLAERLTEVLRQVQGVVNMASQEGGFMTDARLFTASPGGALAAEALVPQAFHGPNVPTPVLTVRPQDPQEEALLRRYASAFLPCDLHNPHDLLGNRLGERFTTLFAAKHLAAYTAPAFFPEGTTITAMPPIPQGMGFYPRLPGEVILGHQFSPETADLTPAAVRLDETRLMHTMFAGDTGFGKSVAAIRWAYESTLHWRLRTVVLDFGAGWRQLLNAPGLEGHVDILQLWPNAARPLRWNPLQIGHHIDPETQWRAFADIFGSVAKLGVKRQKQELLEALRKIYVRAGVLVDDPEVRSDLQWGRVQPDESDLVNAHSGIAISDLTPACRQLLAVFRSTRVSLIDLYKEVVGKLSIVPARDTMLTGVLEGIIFRLNPLVQGAAAAQFSAGPGSLAIEELGKPWGIAIVEGGVFLDDFGKAFLLGWIGWHLYTDMVARRVHEVKTGEPLLQIFFEEANKIFTR
ncbi:MAG: serine-rich protein, partial [Anaerolineales bacterium]